MKVFTENKIIVQRAGQPLPGTFSAAEGDGIFGGKIKDLIGSGKVSGVLDALRGTPAQPVYIAPPEPIKVGLSKNAKIAIGLGSLAIIGLIVFALTRKKKK